MTKPDDKPTREDGAYAAVLGFLRKYTSEILLLSPFALMILLPTRELWAALVTFVWLGEAIAYRAFTGRTWIPFPLSWRLVFIVGFIGYLGVTQVLAWART